MGVSATNLKEVVVTFDGTVDEDTATDKANYALKSGKAIKSVAISADQKSVTVTLADGSTLTNNKKEAISVSNVKAGDVTINEKNVEFNVSDNKLPEVTEIKSLGTKSVKVSFTEPVTDLKQSNFTLDGKAFFGKIDMGAGNKSAILTPFSSSALAVGDHTLTVSAVKDFAGFISLNSTHDFTVVEDLVAPTVTEATATLESVTLTFSEDVDASTVSASKVYWKSGDSKRTASSVEQLADNKYKFNFSISNSLPTGNVDIHVEGVKDYSGNEIAKDTKVSVNPEIDQTRPEVKNATIVDSKTIKVTFSKSINEDSAEEVKNYTVLNKDGKVVSVRSAGVDPQDSKSVIINLYTDLSVGENTLTVKNLKDNTKLQNTMLDYTGKLTRADKANPTFDSTVISTADKRVVLKFNKKMDVESLADYSNYLVQINGQLQALTSDIADISVVQDGTAVVISFPETLNGKDVVFAEANSTSRTHVQKLHVLGVKDANGNLLNEFVTSTNNVLELWNATTVQLKNISTVAAYAGKEAELVDTKTVKVKFNAGINEAEAGAFSYEVAGVEQISEVQVDGTSVVTLKFKNSLGTDAAGLDIDINYSKLVTIAGNTSGSLVTSAITTANLLDSVAPQVKDEGVYTVDGNVIKITYSETLVENTDAAQDLRDTDFEIVRVSDNKTLNPVGDYDVTVAGSGTNLDKEIHITLTDSRSVDTAYRVTVKGADYFTDDTVAENAIEDSVGQSAKVTGNSAGLTGVTLNDTPGSGNDGESTIVLPTASAGNTFVYKVSADSSRVPTPQVGADLSSWTAVANGDSVVVANGKNVGVAEVTSAGKAVKFVNVVASNAAHIPAAPAVKTADATVGLTTNFTSLVGKLVVNSVDVALTNVQGLDGSSTSLTVATIISALQADLDAVYDGTANGAVTFTVEEGTGDNAGKLVIKNDATGSTSTVDLTGSTVADATALGFTTLTAVSGSNASN